MPLLIEPPPREAQIVFNRKRWEEICADPALARLPGKIESNAYGQILMMPPASGGHSSRQGEILFLLRSKLGSVALPECPISTIDGVRAADVGWYSKARFAEVRGQIAFEIAAEICVKILSPSNTTAEMNAKKALYFEAGAEEVWFCDQRGNMQFFHQPKPECQVETFAICPDFPAMIDA